MPIVPFPVVYVDVKFVRQKPFDGTLWVHFSSHLNIKRKFGCLTHFAFEVQM